MKGTHGTHYTEQTTTCTREFIAPILFYILAGHAAYSPNALLSNHSQLSSAVGGAPDSLVGRLYAGQGRNEHLTESSPLRNTSFGTCVRDEQNGDGNILSPVRGRSGLFLRSRTNTPTNAFAQQQQQQLQDPLIPRIFHPPASRGPTPQNLGSINSPPRIGLRRLSSGPARSKTSPNCGASGSGLKFNVDPGKPRGGHIAVEQSPIGWSMSLSRSLGALGQAGRWDDGAPSLGSKQMSPESSLQKMIPSSRRTSPGIWYRRCVLPFFLL